LSSFLTIAAYGLREAVRRRALVVVLVLTAGFLGLYWLGVDFAFEEVRRNGGDSVEGVEVETVAGATLLGLAMFATLFLGAVLAIFLTVGAVRGDAERGLLQPLIVRPVSRSVFLLARFLGAATVAAVYVLVVYFAAAGLTNAAGGWTPDRLVAPGLELAAAVVVITALAVLGSVLLSATANGIALFMLFGAGLVGGLLGQIGGALKSGTLETVAERMAFALPFEALYQDALYRITADTYGLTAFVLELGPFGGADPAGARLPLWILLYLGVVAAAATAAFARRDL
jgi:ABC-type transport system involved in multi-copper enzyme maturation permease subunit